MNDLERCKDLRKQIADLEEKIEDIEGNIRYPKAQTISDMPRGSSTGTNSIERYILQKEKYENRKLMYENELFDLWAKINQKMDFCNINNNEKRVMLLRYKDGLPWKKCTEIMKEIAGAYWTENLTFKTNRKVKKALENCKI